MRSGQFVTRPVLMLMISASLACNAVTNLMRGEGPVNDAQATAEAVLTEAAQVNQAFEATAAADDFDIATPAPAPDIGQPFGSAPADVPVFVDGTVSDFASAGDLMTYRVEAPFRAVVDFYKAEMPASGWLAVPVASFETDELAILSYEMPPRTALLTINPDPSNQRITLVMAVVTP
jgi:hypothetical protein